LPEFAYACGSPLNENAHYTIKSTPYQQPVNYTKTNTGG
jgi:hypothetical protein